MRWEIGNGVFIKYTQKNDWWVVKDPKTLEHHWFETRDDAETFMEKTYGELALEWAEEEA